MKKLTGESLNITEKNIATMRQLFPEAFEEGKIDFSVLRQLLGDFVDDEEERYSFKWNGKGRALRLSQTPSLGTLRPCKKESKNWDTTANLYIEGDNLEVLKLLQKSYYGKVKMIYIDPPYNTGGDFVYKDDFRDNIENYKRVTGQVDGEGHRIDTNTESNGRFHTDWLNMMYPRLRLARNLLSDDGVIFISIDDNEQENLKKICDEVFGENLIAIFTWVKKKKGSHLSKTVRGMTEYIVAFAKKCGEIELYGEDAYSDKKQPLAKRTNSHKTLSISANLIQTTLEDGTYEGKQGSGTSALNFEKFTVENHIVTTPCVVSGPFIWTQSKLEEELKAGTKIYLSGKFGFNVLRSDQEDKIKRPSTLIDSKNNVGTNEDAYDECIDIFQQEGIMSYPKPSTLMTYLISTLTHFDKNSLILDFFSGSATTAHAVMQLNAEDGGHRKFIMVQLPEPTAENSEAAKAGYKNICEIGKERIRRAGEKIKAECPRGDTSLDIGFKVFKLDSSNLQKWNPQPEDLQLALQEATDNFLPGRSQLDVVYEILLKMGLDLALPIEERQANGETVYIIGGGALMICLGEHITLPVAEEIAKLHKEYDSELWQVVFRDTGFASDMDKTNIKETLKTAGLDEDSFVCV